jgi:Fe-S cluster assembly protein SufD
VTAVPSASLRASVSTDLRERAAERFTELGWPTTRLEAWKYTNLAPVQKIAWRFDENPQAIDSPATLASHAALELQFVNGILVRDVGQTLLSVRTDDAGTDESAGTDKSVCPTPSYDFTQSAMVALNLANTRGGARIDIPANAVVDGFIHLLFISNGDGIWSHPRNVVHVGRGAQVTLVETYVGTGRYFTNAVTEIVAEDGAVVDHYRLECESIEAFHVGNVFIRQGRSSNVISRSIAVGGALVRNEVHVLLDGEGASLGLEGLFVGTGTQHIDNHTVIDHARPHCESHELYKGVLDQSSRGVFDGRIIVRPGAIKTSSKQENRNMLLSETAIVDSKPTLEIHNDDVKCNHGSTIGQIDQEQLFYLRSRGIGEEDARNLLVHAFASEIVDRMKIEPVREQIRRALFRTLPERMPERRGNTR